jgi:ProP effector
MATTPDKPDANATIAALVDLFPAAFSNERWQPHKPLKIGVDRDLVSSGVLTEPEVHTVLWEYTRRYQYFVAIARGGPRFDLNGQVCGEVTPEQQADAAIAAAHVEAIAENQFRDSRARFHSTRRTKPEPTLPPTEPAPPLAPTLPTGRRLTLADLRRLGHERKAAVAFQ